MKIKGTVKAIYNAVILEISKNAADEIIKKKEKFTCEEKQLFIAILEDHKYLAIDNSSGECFVEEFKIKEDAYIWLFGLKEAEPLKAAEENLKEWY